MKNPFGSRRGRRRRSVGGTADRLGRSPHRKDAFFNSPGEHGFAFVMVLLAALLVAGIATTLAVVSATESQISANYRESKQTVYLAEAGIQHALWQLLRNPDNLAPILEQSVAPGKYDAMISKQASGLFEIQARGRTDRISGTGLSVQASVFPQAYNYVVLNLIDNSLGADIQGAEGTTPTVPDLTVDWTALAAAADWYLSGNTTYDEDFYFSGLIYVAGDIKLNGDENWIEGTIVSEYNIVFEPGSYVHVAASPGMPALVAQNDIFLGKDGDYGQISVRGLVYADHNINLKKYNDLWVKGTVMAKGKFEINRECTSVTVIWDPTIRLDRVFGISQSSGSHAWAFVPGTWRVLSDMSGFETH